jgi:hypothetical protein
MIKFEKRINFFHIFWVCQLVGEIIRVHVPDPTNWWERSSECMYQTQPEVSWVWILPETHTVSAASRTRRATNPWMSKMAKWAIACLWLVVFAGSSGNGAFPRSGTIFTKPLATLRSCPTAYTLFFTGCLTKELRGCKVARASWIWPQSPVTLRTRRCNTIHKKLPRSENSTTFKHPWKGRIGIKNSLTTK